MRPTRWATCAYRSKLYDTTITQTFPPPRFTRSPVYENLASGLPPFDVAHFLRKNYPECRSAKDITPKMVDDFIAAALERRLATGTLGRYQSGIRKLDEAMRPLKIKPADAPPLLPTMQQGGKRGFRAETSTETHSEEQAESILDFIKKHGTKKYGPTAALMVELMISVGLRISEAVYLRAENIDETERIVWLEKNRNRSKGGRPRETLEYDQAGAAFMSALKRRGEQNPTGHIFKNRSSLGDQVGNEIRRACSALAIKSLGTHAFRKRNAQNHHARLIVQGLSDAEARMQVAKHLGHNRLNVVSESYVPPQDQER